MVLFLTNLSLILLKDELRGILNILKVYVSKNCFQLCSTKIEIVKNAQTHSTMGTKEKTFLKKTLKQTKEII